MKGINREYKDRLFSFLFGNEENKEWTLSLYNGVNHSSYSNADDLHHKSIREVLYLGMHNDVSFLIANEISLYEQQSTFNPNMPLRQLQYAGNLYERYIKENGLNKYGFHRLRLPVPKLVTFYNGRDNLPDETILRLSDMFPPDAEPDIEVTVRMINVNYGHSLQLMESCRPLWEYSWLVHEIRIGLVFMDIESAVNRAISGMPENFVIRPFLEAHRAEVYGMLLTEYNEAEAMELFRKDGRREGVEEGWKKGRKKGRIEGRIEGREKTLEKSIRALMKQLHITPARAMDLLEIPEEERAKYLARL